MATIRKRGGTYLVQVYAGRDKDGNVIRQNATFRPDPDRTARQNQKALQAFAVDFERKVQEGLYLDGERVTFRRFTETWLEEYAGQHLAPPTVRAYKALLDKHILPAIGEMKLARIQPRALNKFFGEMLAKDKENGTGKISPSSVIRAKAVISSIFSTAVKWGVVADNPCRRTDPPRKGRDDTVKYFTEEQAQRFLEALERPMVCPRKAHDRKDDTGKPYHVDAYVELQPIPQQIRLFLYMAIFLGCRSGELVALQWDDIDFANARVTVRRSAASVNGVIINKETKNRTSTRTIAIPQGIMGMLSDWKKAQMERMMELGTYWKGHRGKEYGKNFIFIQDDGAQMYPTTPYAAFKKILRRYNDALPEGEEPLPDIPLHGLRHTSATLMISQNVDVRTVSGRLGHAQTSTTLNIYAHSLSNKDKEAAETLERLLIGK